MKQQDPEALHQKLLTLDELQVDCTHCGLCSEVCTTFQASGWEQESPRGRIKLAKEFMNGRILPDSPILETFDRCVGCRLCECTCPYEVKYSQLREVVQDLRSQLLSSSEDGKIYRNWIKLAYRLGSIFWRSYGWTFISKSIFQSMKTKRSYIHQFYQSKKSLQQESRPIMLAIGCLQDILQHDVIDSAINVLRKLGFQPYLDKNQPCCGAIFERLIHEKEAFQHFKDQIKVKSYQKERLDHFSKWMNSPVLFLSEGCACFVKRKIGASQQAHILDLYSFLLKTLEENKLKLILSNPRKVYLQPYCGSAKNELKNEFRALLEKIEGLSVVELPNPSTCCGGYGCEALWRPQQAKKWIRNKTSILQEQDTLVVASIECYIQFSLQNSLGLEILHPLQIIDQCKILVC